MVSNKAKIRYGKHYPRKDRRADYVGMKYKMFFHYSSGSSKSGSRAKYYRKQANQKLRRYKGDVGDHGWYKRFEEVWYNVF